MTLNTSTIMLPIMGRVCALRARSISSSRSLTIVFHLDAVIIMKDDHPVAPHFLCSIQAAISSSHQVGVLPPFLRHRGGDSDAHGHVPGHGGALVRYAQSGYFVHDPLGYLHRLLLSRSGEDAGKLVSPITGNQVAGPSHRPAQGDCYLLEAVIARQVSVPVVKLLEVVDVDDEK